MNFGQTSFRVSMSGKLPSFSHIFPRNGIHGTVDFFIGRYVVNDLDSLQVFIIIDLITDNEVLTQEFW